MLPLLYQVAQIIDSDEIGIPTTPASGDSVKSILQIVFTIAGGISLVFIVIGGMKYVLSSGDPQQTAKAKDTIMYAIIGLIFALIAFVIVSIVVRTAQQ